MIKRYVILYHSVGPDLFSYPEYTHKEIVSCNSRIELRKYIESKQDLWGGNFKKNPDFGNKKGVSAKFHYISHGGGVIVRPYVPPTFKNISKQEEQ